MPRTPLPRLLRRISSDVARARARGVSLDVLRDERARAVECRAEQGRGYVTRRDVLRYAAATAAATTALLTLPRSARARRAQPEIAIVGAGISGLTAALTLADHRIASTVYEASGRVGGRMFSTGAGYWKDGQSSEWGGELIDTGHRTIRTLAHRFRLPLVDLHAAEPHGAEDTDFFLAGRYRRNDVEHDFAAIVDRLAADVDAAGYPTTYASSTAAGRLLDSMSVFDWIETRVPGGHGSRLGLLLDVAYNTEYGADTTDQSALNLVYLLGFQPRRFAEFGESDERFHIIGGNQQLPEAIAAHLGEIVKRNMSLERLALRADGRYALDFRSHQRSRQVVADAVILALPFAVLRDLDIDQAGFDGLKLQAIDELGRGHNAKLQLQFERRLWNDRDPQGVAGNGSSFADTGYQGGWDVTRGQPGTRGVMNLYLGGSVADSLEPGGRAFATANSAHVKRSATAMLARVEPVFPGITGLWNHRSTLSLPHLSPFFRCSYSYWRVGQYQKIAGYEAVPQGGVFFAGEHTSIGFQGFMEGGAAEGKRAALELLRRMRRRA